MGGPDGAGMGGGATGLDTGSGLMSTCEVGAAGAGADGADGAAPACISGEPGDVGSGAPPGAAAVEKPPNRF